MTGRLALQALWLAAPVTITGILHMVIVKKRLFERWSIPLDGGRTLGGKRIFGDNKTWRGVFVMTVLAAALGAAQGALLGEWAAGAGAAPFDYAGVGRRLGAPPGAAAHALGYAVVGVLLGFGYALGELPNSFLKRRFDVPPGEKGAGAAGTFFFLLDQVDSVVGALALFALAFGMSLRFFAVAVVALAALHLAVTTVLFVARVKRAI